MPCPASRILQCEVDVLYCNHTRHAAIVTVRVISVIDPKKSLFCARSGIKEWISAAPGAHDFVVPPGTEVHPGENTDAELMAVRSVPL